MLFRKFKIIAKISLILPKKRATIFFQNVTSPKTIYVKAARYNQKRRLTQTKTK